MRIHILTLLTVLILLGACAQNRPVLTTQQKMAQADSLFAKGKFERAASLYDAVYLERSSSYVARALMRKGDSYFKLNKFIEAREAYQEYISVFANFPDVNNAVFQVAVCLYEESQSAHYDQSVTLEAIDSFRKFMEKYPRDPRNPDALRYIQKAQYKLIEKKYLNGYIYYKMKDYSAALMYFQEVMDLGNTDSLDRQSRYYTALLYQKQDLKENAREAYNSLKAKYPGSKETKKLAKLFP